MLHLMHPGFCGVTDMDVLAWPFALEASPAAASTLLNRFRASHAMVNEDRAMQLRTDGAVSVER